MEVFDVRMEKEIGGIGVCILTDKSMKLQVEYLIKATKTMGVVVC